MDIRSNKQLIDGLSQGLKIEFIYFWGHRNSTNKLNKSCFSQWYESAFEADGIQYLTAEHYMMHAKALLFDDALAAEKILSVKTPKEAKSIGREIQNFDNEAWISHRFDIVVRANLAKFSSSAELTSFLLSTGDSLIVEASPVDKIWGVGLAQSDSLIGSPANWQGLNLLGYALMEVRSKLAKR
ncbi:NADAR family protein [Marinomonas sp. PE14-40]|uniref:NADAR family protein n=1 Tax=Marinomonas sp. PE14-40 TaxID=3060621 RepID=UPI003F67FC1B